ELAPSDQRRRAVAVRRAGGNFVALRMMGSTSPLTISAPSRASAGTFRPSEPILIAGPGHFALILPFAGDSASAGLEAWETSQQQNTPQQSATRYAPVPDWPSWALLSLSLRAGFTVAPILRISRPCFPNTPRILTGKRRILASSSASC